MKQLALIIILAMSSPLWAGEHDNCAPIDETRMAYTLALSLAVQLINVHDKLSKAESYELYDSCKMLLRQMMASDPKIEKGSAEALKTVEVFRDTYPNPNND
jgi:hypothetical protein